MASPTDQLAGRPELGLLMVAVPMWIAEIRSWPEDQRLAVARECAQIIASQGDTLQYGSRHKFGHAAKQIARHQAGGTCPPEDPKTCSCKGKGCGDKKCWCHISGEPAYSAGEVFNALARGLACAAYQPGGVTFAGMAWKAGPANGER